MKTCERCSKEHNGEYGSGRFCGEFCRRARRHSQESKEKISDSLRRLSKMRITSTDAKVIEYNERIQKKRDNKLSSRPFDELGWESKRQRIIKEQKNACAMCFNDHWMTQPIVLEIHHINGEKDHSRENLMALCPNCHSTTDTWRGKNKNKVTQKVSDAELMDALRTLNIRQALLKVGLAAKGGNYRRAKKLKLLITTLETMETA